MLGQVITAMPRTDPGALPMPLFIIDAAPAHAHQVHGLMPCKSSPPGRFRMALTCEG